MSELNGSEQLRMMSAAHGLSEISVYANNLAQLKEYSDKEKDEIFKDFNDAVNMSPKEIEDWLDGDASKSVGYNKEKGDTNTKSDKGSSVGRKSAKKIIKLLEKKRSEWTSSDYQHANKVAAYNARHKCHNEKDPDSRGYKSCLNWAIRPPS